MSRMFGPRRSGRSLSWPGLCASYSVPCTCGTLRGAGWLPGWCCSHRAPACTSHLLVEDCCTSICMQRPWSPGCCWPLKTASCSPSACFQVGVLCAPAEAQAARLMPPPQGRSPRAAAAAAAARTTSGTASVQPTVSHSTGSGSLGGQAEAQLWGSSSLGGQAGGPLTGSGALSSQGSLLPSISMDAFIRDMLLQGVATDAAAAAEASRALSRDVGPEGAGAELGRSQAAAGRQDAVAVHLCCIMQVL